MLDQQTIKKLKKILFRHLDPKKDQVFIFGSRAEKGARKFSDIDIGVISKREIDWLKIEAIKEEFEESDIPYRVDVVDIKNTTNHFRKVALQKIIPLKSDDD